jgi:hypothetical protein
VVCVGVSVCDTKQVRDTRLEQQCPERTVPKMSSRKVVLSEKKAGGGGGGEERSGGGAGRHHHRRDRGDRDDGAAAGASEDAAVSSSSRRASGRRVDYDEGEAAEITTDADVEVYSTFDELGLKEDLLRGIYAYGE